MLSKIFDKLSTMRPRQLLALSIGMAIFIFALMFLGFTLLTKNQVTEEVKIEPVEEPPVEIQMKSVVVATRNIEPKVMLTGKMLELKEFPADSVPIDAVTDVTEIVNLPTRAKIFKGDIMTSQKVFKNTEQAGFVGSIPPNCRAVAVNINDVTGVAGFAKPGDYVDVLLVERDDGTATSSVLLQNVLLLSINKSMGIYQPPEKEDETPINPSARAIDNPAIATLALRPEDVLLLISASKLGEIYLVLRPFHPQSGYDYGADYTAQSLRSQRKQQEEQQNISTPALEIAQPAPEEFLKATKPKQDSGFDIIYGNR